MVLLSLVCMLNTSTLQHSCLLTARRDMPQSQTSDNFPQWPAETTGSFLVIADKFVNQRLQIPRIGAIHWPSSCDEVCLQFVVFPVGCAGSRLLELCFMTLSKASSISRQVMYLANNPEVLSTAAARLASPAAPMPPTIHVEPNFGRV